MLKQKITILAAMTGFAAASGSAGAATLDFSDLQSGNCGFLGSQAVSQGYKFTDISQGDLYLCNAGVIQNNTTPALIAANAPSILGFERSDSALFSLQSFFAGARTRDFDPTGVNGVSNADGIIVTGVTGAFIVTQTFNFTGVNFSQFTLSPAFTGLSSVMITAFGTVQSPEFLINNIVVDSAVPEPASWVMMIIGFGMVGSAVRRNRRGFGKPGIA